MRLISPATAGAAATIVTLENAWREAERLGRIEVDRDYNDTIYRVEIIFDNGTGSHIRARGNHPQILDAVLAAITEAKRLQ